MCKAPLWYIMLSTRGWDLFLAFTSKHHQAANQWGRTNNTSARPSATVPLVMDIICFKWYFHFQNEDTWSVTFHELVNWSVLESRSKKQVGLVLGTIGPYWHQTTQIQIYIQMKIKTLRTLCDVYPTWSVTSLELVNWSVLESKKQVGLVLGTIGPYWHQTTQSGGWASQLGRETAKQRRPLADTHRGIFLTGFSSEKN